MGCDQPVSLPGPYTVAVWTGRPFRAQYSMPPIISRTGYPRVANAGAANVLPLQPAPGVHDHGRAGGDKLLGAGRDLRRGKVPGA